MVLGQGTGDRETGQETGRFQNHREALVWSRCRTPSILDPKAPNGSSGRASTILGDSLPVPAHRPDLYTTSKHITYWYPYQVVSEDLVFRVRHSCHPLPPLLFESLLVLSYRKLVRTRGTCCVAWGGYR